MEDDARMELFNLLSEAGKMEAILHHVISSVEHVEVDSRRETISRAMETCYIAEDVFGRLKESIKRIDDLICKNL